MPNRLEILNELEGISPFVAKIGAENLYEVPAGYFDKLPAEIVNRVLANETVSSKSETEALSNIIGSIDKKNIFSIPDNYFETFAESLMNKIKLQQAGSAAEELENISSFVNKITRKVPFNIPDGYFENFAESVINKINENKSDSVDEELESISPFLNKLSKKTPFSIPDNYFKELAGNAMAGAKAVDFVNDELENLSPILSELKNKNVYETPTGYFENFATTVLDKIKKQQPAKVISLNKKTNWLRYAAAAIVVGIISTTAILVFNNKKTSPIYSFAKLDAQQLTDSLHNTKDEDILSYFQNFNIPISDTASGMASINLNDNDAADDMLADISDNELQQYVDEYNDSKEPITN